MNRRWPRLWRSSATLAAVTSKVQGQVVRRYELGYDASRATGRSLLARLTECTSEPCTAATSLPPTRFSYHDAPPAYREEALPGGAGLRERLVRSALRAVARV